MVEKFTRALPSLSAGLALLNLGLSCPVFAVKLKPGYPCS